MDDMFGAGSETTTTTMRWAFLFFAHWPEVQDKAYETMVKEFGTDRLPVLSDRQSLTYVDAIVHEVLRMACIAPFAVPHKTTCDTTLGGYDIPKDTQVCFYFIVLSHLYVSKFYSTILSYISNALLGRVECTYLFICNDLY